MAAVKRTRASKVGPRRPTARTALAFVRKHGVVLFSARGAAPSLVEWVAGEPIRGSWWAHPRAHEIYAIAEAVCASRDVLVCRLLGGKRTLVHARLWPALIRAAEKLPAKALVRVSEEHTARGHHAVREAAFPEWVPREARRAAEKLRLESALAQLEKARVAL